MKYRIPHIDFECKYFKKQILEVPEALRGTFYVKSKMHTPILKMDILNKQSTYFDSLSTT